MKIFKHAIVMGLAGVLFVGCQTPQERVVNQMERVQKRMTEMEKRMEAMELEMKAKLK